MMPICKDKEFHFYKSIYIYIYMYGKITWMVPVLFGVLWFDICIIKMFDLIFVLQKNAIGT